jgi:hypothetical protein
LWKRMIEKKREKRKGSECMFGGPAVYEESDFCVQRP